MKPAPSITNDPTLWTFKTAWNSKLVYLKKKKKNYTTESETNT